MEENCNNCFVIRDLTYTFFTNAFSDHLNKGQHPVLWLQGISYHKHITYFIIYTWCRCKTPQIMRHLHLIIVYSLLSDYSIYWMNIEHSYRIISLFLFYVLKTKIFNMGHNPQVILFQNIFQTCNLRWFIKLHISVLWGILTLLTSLECFKCAYMMRNNPQNEIIDIRKWF